MYHALAYLNEDIEPKHSICPYVAVSMKVGKLNKHNDTR